MSIEQAIIEINQSATIEERLWAIESILSTLKHELASHGNFHLQDSMHQITIDDIPTFAMGSSTMPNREEMYSDILANKLK